MFVIYFGLRNFLEEFVRKFKPNELVLITTDLIKHADDFKQYVDRLYVCKPCIEKRPELNNAFNDDEKLSYADMIELCDNKKGIILIAIEISQIPACKKFLETLHTTLRLLIRERVRKRKSQKSTS